MRLGSRSDRGFLVEEFVRRVRFGEIGPACHVTAERSDGAGAQAQAKMAAFALARAYGLTYVHARFSRVEHAEGPADEWTAAWENMFNLGHGEVRVTECPLPRIAIEEFMADKRWWQSPCLLSAGHFVRFADREPAAMSAAASQLRAKYYLGTARRPRSSVVEICAHLRRGDVAANDAETAGRFVSADALAASIARTRLVLTILGLPSRVRLFSQVEKAISPSSVTWGASCT
jgi:hypothetical protein